MYWLPWVAAAVFGIAAWGSHGQYRMTMRSTQLGVTVMLLLVAVAFGCYAITL
jgi:hypothetical protein